MGTRRVKRSVACLVLVSLVTVGTAFAASDEGTSLQSWSEHRFKQVIKEIETNVNPLLVAAQDTLEGCKSRFTESAKTNLTLQAKNTTDRVSGGISIRSAGYIDQIRKETQELQNGVVHEDFRQFVGRTNSKVSDDLNNAAQGYLLEVTDELDTLASTAKSVD